MRQRIEPAQRFSGAAPSVLSGRRAGLRFIDCRPLSGCKKNTPEETACVLRELELPLTRSAKGRHYMRLWQVREITSSCCSRVRSMNFTAYPETRMVKFAYSGFSGCSIASMSFSVPKTLTLRW